MYLTDNQKQIYKMCEDKLCLKGKLGEEYYYNSLVFCLIDAIFSIGVRYQTVRNTVINYCGYFNLERCHEINEKPSDSHTIDDFIMNIEKYEPNSFGRDSIYNNRQLTSSRNGISKAEAVYNEAKILQSLGIKTIKDIQSYGDLDELEKKFKMVKGQKSGISFSYFMMLAGDDDKMKMDRWLIRFSEKATGKKCGVEETEKDLMAVYNELKTKYLDLTPRSLDYDIWLYAKNNKLLK